MLVMVRERAPAGGLDGGDTAGWLAAVWTVIEFMTDGAVWMGLARAA